MKHLALIAACGLLGTWMARAEPRVFTNTEGKKVEAELMAVDGEIVVIKLTNGSSVKVPIKSLSADDQAFIAAWWEENKDKLKSTDVVLTITKKTERIDRKVTRTGGTGGTGGGQGAVNAPLVKKLTIDDFHYECELKSYSHKSISDIAVDYTIYKRVSTTDKEGSESVVEEIDGTETIKLLEAQGRASFETDVVTCEDSSETGGNKPRELKRETILGVVVHLSAGGHDFLSQSYPENFLERIDQLE
jgi:hypothetical protein